MKLKDMIGSMVTKFAALALALTCVRNVWGAETTTIQNAAGEDITVYVVADGFYQDAATYDDSTDFYITSKAGLEYFRDLVNQVGTVADTYVSTFDTDTAANWYTENIFTGKTVHLMTDVDLGNVEWSPIGQPKNAAGDKRCFYGNFDGEGHKVSNLKATTYTEAIKTWYPGLFGTVSGTQTFSNLTIENVTLVGYDYAGAIIGNAGSNATAFNNCHVTGNIDIKCTMVDAFVGGIVGIGTSAIDDCSVEGTVGSTIQGSTVGGLAGTSTRTAKENANTVTDSKVTGVTVKSDDNGGQAGGLVGKATNPVTVTGNTVHDVTVSAEAGKADVLVGGVGGDVTASSNTTDTNVTVISDPYAAYVKVADGFYQNAATYDASTDFYITSKEGLEYFRDIVNGAEIASTNYVSRFVSVGNETGAAVASWHQGNVFSKMTVHLMVDIDLNNEQWTPIGYSQGNATVLGTSVTKNTFYGTFDAGIYDGGNNLIGTHTVSNLYVYTDSTTTKGYIAGFFGRIQGSAAIKNLTIENVNIHAYDYIGAVVGQPGTGGNVIVENCHVNGTINISGYRFMGGIAGHGYCTITNCTMGGNGTVASSAQCVGAMIGFLGSGSISDCTVSNVTISTGTFRIGAIAGDVGGGSTINGCVVSNTTVTAANASTAYSGVVAGYLNSAAMTVLADNKVYDTTATAAGAAVTAQLGSANRADYAIIGADVSFDDSGKVTGGIFENIPASAIASGYVTADNPNTETNASYPLTIGGPYVAVIYDENDVFKQGYRTLKSAFDAVNNYSEDSLVIKVLQDVPTSDWSSEVDLEWTKNVLIDTPVVEGVTINLNNVNLFAEDGKDMEIGEKVTISRVLQFGSYQANTVSLNGNVNAFQLWAYQGTVFVNPSANVTLYTDGQMGMWSGGHYAIQGDLADAVNANIGSLTPQINGGYFKYFFGNNSVSLKDTYVNAALVTWDDRYSDYQFDLSLTNSILVVGSENQTGLDLGSQSTGIISLQSSRIISSVGRVTINANDTVYMDWKSSITATTFANNGVINIDATGIAEPVKVIDYTGSGTMALADYGTVNVTGGTAYVDGNDLWITMPPVAEAYDAEGGTLIGQFATVNEAIAAAGATYVKLLDNVTLTAPLTMANSSSYTLDFDGKTIYYNTTATTVINGSSNIIFKNGKLDISSCAISSSTDQGLLIFRFNPDGNILTFDKMELYGKNCRTYGIFSFANSTNGSTVNFINGSRIAIENESNLDYSDIFKGLGSTYPYVVNITDSTVSCTNVTRFSLYGTVNVKDSTVTFTGGENAFRKGAFTFDNSTVTVSGAKAGEGKGLVPCFSDTIVTNGSALTFIGSNIGKDILFEHANNIVIYDTSTVTAASVSGAAADRAIVAPANYVLVTTDNGGASVTYSVAPAVASIDGTSYATFADAIAAAEEYAAAHDNTYPTITVLDDTAEIGNDDWKIADGKLVKKNYVAQIGTTKYETLAEAFAAVQDGETIQLIADCETGSQYTLTNPLVLTAGNVTLDLNGKTITATGNFSFLISGNNAIVKNGTIQAGANTAKKTGINSYAIVVNGCDGVKLSGLTVNGGVSVGGSTGETPNAASATNVVIEDCTVTSGDFYAVCAQQNSTVTIASGSYTANTASSNSGTLYASFVGTDGPKGTIYVTGGKFAGKIPSGNKAGDIVISGGVYSVVPDTKFCAVGYEVVDNTDGETSASYPKTVAHVNTGYIVEKDNGEGYAVIPSVDSDWIKENVKPAGATTAEIEDALNKPYGETNLKKWQAYVLNQTTPIKVTQVGTAGALTTTLVNDARTDTGLDVSYSLVSVGGESETDGTASANKSFALKTAEDGSLETGLYKVRVHFKPTGDTSASEVTVDSENTVGVLKTTPASSLVVVPVPFKALGGSGEINVSDYIKSGLANGDTLHVYNGDNYDTWTYNGSSWDKTTNVTKTDENTESTSESAEPSVATLSRGTAAILRRSGSTDTPLVFVGDYTGAAEQQIAEGWNLVASPSIEDFDPATKFTSGKIQIPTGGIPLNYTYSPRTKKWGYTTSINNKPTRVEDPIPAGTGFWYISDGDKKVTW